MRAIFRNTILMTLFMVSNHVFVFGQDSTIFHQVKARMFSNNYIFFSNNTFEHFFYTDDGQVWYGKGTYKDKHKKRILRFGDADTTFKTSLWIHYESNFSRILKIRGHKFLSDDFYGTTRKKKVIFLQRN